MNGVRSLISAALVLLGLLAAFAFSPAAYAQDACGPSAGCDQGHAYSAAASIVKSKGQAYCKEYGVQFSYAGPVITRSASTGGAGSYSAKAQCRSESGGSAPIVQVGNTYFTGLCASRLDGQAGMINGTLYSGGVCDNGCKVQPNLDPGTNFSLKEQGNPNAISIRAGTWRATGDVCTADETPPKPEKKDEYCHTTSSGHKVCKGKDKTCVSTASGFRTCASDTNNSKGHTETNKSRTEAASIGSPDTPPNQPSNRPGENWQPSGGTTNITNNNTGSTTNNQNYTNQGTPNGNDPVPGDGSGPGQGGSNGNGGEGEGEGKGDSAGDSGNCSAPPQCTGDTLKCLQLTYTWKIQCHTKGSEITGGEGCTDADVPVCAGTTCKAETYASLLQEWRQRCAAKSMADGMADRASNIRNPDDEGVVDDIWIKEESGNGPKLRQDLISVGGSGPLLPNVSLAGMAWEAPPQFYDAINGVKFLIIAMCTVLAMFIVGRNM